MRTRLLLPMFFVAGCTTTLVNLDAGIPTDTGSSSDASAPTDSPRPDAGVVDVGIDVPISDSAPDATIPAVDAPVIDVIAVNDGGDVPAEDTRPTTDAALPSDAGSVLLGVGASAVARRIYATSPATGTLTTPAVTTRMSGSVMLVSIARGLWSAAPDAPTDSKGNVFAALGTTHAYMAWPTSRTGLYDKINAVGGTQHTFSMTWGNIGGSGDEVTVSAVEVEGATVIHDSAWVERTGAATITSGTVQTTAPAVLVAWWWGSGGVMPAGQSHVAAPGNSFTLLPAATGLTSLSTNGYVQVAAAYRVVQTPGTYSITWTTNGEGAQLYLVALQAN